MNPGLLLLNTTLSVGQSQLYHFWFLIATLDYVTKNLFKDSSVGHLMNWPELEWHVLSAKNMWTTMGSLLPYQSFSLKFNHRHQHKIKPGNDLLSFSSLLGFLRPFSCVKFNNGIAIPKVLSEEYTIQSWWHL